MRKLHIQKRGFYWYALTPIQRIPIAKTKKFSNLKKFWRSNILSKAGEQHE